MNVFPRVFEFRADVRSGLFVVIALVLAGVQWNGLLRHPLLYAASLCFAFFGCVIDHNHQHRPTFRVPWLNRIFGVLITWTVGQPASAIIPMHVGNHHRHNNGDEDLVRSSLVDFRWKPLNLLLFPFVAFRGFATRKAQVLREWARRNPDLYRQLVIERCAFYPVLLALLVTSPIDTLIYFAVPWVFGQWAIIAINHVQHHGCDPDSELNHTRNFTGRWINWWTFNNGFHTAHHLQPRLHWTRLPRLHAELEPRLDPDLQEPSMPRALLRLYLRPRPRTVIEEGTS